VNTKKRLKQWEPPEDRSAGQVGGRVVHRCKRCGTPMTLGAVVSRFRDQPAFMVFECTTCRLVTWIAREDEGPPQ
jgi:hypothetical protein